LFGVLLPYVEEHLGGNIVFEECSGEFPDCVMIVGGRRVRVEFEVYASNFIRHGHDPEKCDLLICWENDLAEPPVEDVLELREIVERLRERGVRLFESYEECPGPGRWPEKLFFEELEGRVDQATCNLVKELYRYVRELSSKNWNLRVRFGAGRRIPTVNFVFLNIVPNRTIIGVEAVGRSWVNYCANITFPEDVELKLREIFGEPEKQWHYIPINAENVEKIKEAINWLLTYQGKQAHN